MADHKINAILTGATGMVGEGVLHECLLHPDVESVLVINRKPCGLSHPKLKEVIQTDFFDLSAIENQLSGYNACFFCAGVSSVGMKEPEYYRLTYTLTLHVAQTLSKLNPGMVFCYVSGSGTDSTGKGRIMWARVKGKTENDLMKLPFRQTFAFRPAFMLPNKHIVRACQYTSNQLNGPAMCGMVQDVDWNGTITWQYTYSTSVYCSHHDIHPMPNGNVLLIAYEVKSATQAVEAGCSQSMTIWPDKIVEIKPSGASGGEVVWEWHAWDHLVQNHDATKSNFGVIADHPELLNINYNTQKDWMHTNGIDYNEALDQIVISSHYLNEIYVIDHSTNTAEAASHSGGNSGKGGDILYRWRNPAAYSQGTTANQDFKVVHDAHWVPSDCPNANYLVGFNNQGASGNSSIDMISPPYNGYSYILNSGSAYAPVTYTYRHNCLGNSADQSNSQQFPNGNMLVCIASTGYIYEIDANQNLLWSITAGGTTPKALRYPASYFLTTGVEETTSISQSFVIKPNPARGKVTIEVPVQETLKDVQVFNSIGTQLLKPVNSNTLDLSVCPEGFYYLRISLSSGTVMTRKVLLKK